MKSTGLNSERHPRAAVIGANGQDGRFICRALSARGYEILACGRQDRFAESVSAELAGRLFYMRVDLTERGSVASALARFRPDVVFHLAAEHTSSTGVPYEGRFARLIDVNLVSLQETLETLRSLPSCARLVYASSAKAFGAALPERITEESPLRSDCLYALSKNAARDLVAYYRKAYGIHGTVLFLFNHESELRKREFFIPTLVGALARAMRDRDAKVELETLDFYADWGSAREYMEIAIDVAERAPSAEFIVATGHATHARGLANRLFRAAGLDCPNHVIEKSGSPGQRAFHADNSRLRAAIGRVPEISIYEICQKILSANYSLHLATAPPSE